MSLARPHKFLDAKKLEDWCIKTYPDVFEEWELSGVAEYIEFWDWLMQDCPGIMNEFKLGFRPALALRNPCQGAADGP